MFTSATESAVALLGWNVSGSFNCDASSAELSAMAAQALAFQCLRKACCMSFHTERRSLEYSLQNHHERCTRARAQADTGSANDPEFEQYKKQAQSRARAGLSQDEAARTLVKLAEEDCLTGVRFAEVLQIVDKFDVNPYAGYTSGKGTQTEMHNAPGQNVASAKVFYLCSSLNTSKEATLRLFCEHYERVLNEPDGSSHQNIRNFMRDGWSGIEFDGPILLDNGEQVNVAAVDEV